VRIKDHYYSAGGARQALDAGIQYH
jgi:hypothetical protein